MESEVIENQGDQRAHHDQGVLHLNPRKYSQSENFAYLDSSAPLKETFQKIAVHCKEGINKAKKEIMREGQP